MRRCAVIIEHDPESGSCGAYAPDLPGCGAAAETREDVLALIHEAIEFHLEGLHDEGLPIPEAMTTAEYIEAS